MQIDFHHAVTYVLARLSGFAHAQADIVAYSAQYVDDATNEGLIHFTNGALYKRTSSAHKTFDYRNLGDLSNRQVWIPFHFLPGNGGLPAGESPPDGFIEKLICKPDSYVARDMVRECIRDKNSPFALQRLGITLHVYADTWAHQGFAGVSHKVNDISHLDDIENPGGLLSSRVKDFFGDLFDEEASRLAGDVLPLGHGAALSYPDRPYLRWCYRDHKGMRVERDNTLIFMDACDKLCRAMQRFLAGNADAAVPGLKSDDRDKIEHLFRNIRDEDGEKRHKRWLEYIANGYFSFAPTNIAYIEKGRGSWKHAALGTEKLVDAESDRFEYKEAFLKDNWKLFHDALQAHRFYVLHLLLPQYGICAA